MMKMYIYAAPRHFWSKTSKSSSGTRFGIQFGLRNQPDSTNLKQAQLSHTESVGGPQVLDGKLISSSFQRIRPHLQIPSGLIVIIKRRRHITCLGQSGLCNRTQLGPYAGGPPEGVVTVHVNSNPRI